MLTIGTTTAAVIVGLGIGGSGANDNRDDAQNRVALSVRGDDEGGDGLVRESTGGEEGVYGSASIPPEPTEERVADESRYGADGGDLRGIGNTGATPTHPQELADVPPDPRPAAPAPTREPPVPTRTPAPVAVAPGGAGGDVRAIICSVPWPCEEALRVAFCESSLSPGAISPDGRNYGLMQVNIIHHARVGGDVSRLLNAAVNVAVAYQIYAAAGYTWQPWSCKP